MARKHAVNQAQLVVSASQESRVSLVRAQNSQRRRDLVQGKYGTQQLRRGLQARRATGLERRLEVLHVTGQAIRKLSCTVAVKEADVLREQGGVPAPAVGAVSCGTMRRTDNAQPGG